MDEKTIKIYKEFTDVLCEFSKIGTVEISFGYNENGFCKDGLIIKECPPIVIKKLIEKDFIIFMTHNGLRVDKVY